MQDLTEDCFDGILDGLFNATCPNAQFNTLNVIQKIKQCYKDAQGNECCMTLQKFYSQLFTGLS